MILDCLVGLGNYWDHLRPIWEALAPEERGTLFARGPARDHVARDGWAHSWKLPDGQRPVLVASARDMKRVPPPGQVVLLEHGAGQSYYGADGHPDGNPSNPGGRGRERVALFLCPNQSVADRNLAAYPRNRVAVVGAPKLDRWHRNGESNPREAGFGGPPAPGAPGGSIVAISMHWNNPQVPEARWAFPYFRKALIAEAQRRPLLGHAHPRVWATLGPWYERHGIEPVETFDEVLERADLYVVDNSCVVPETPVLCADLLWREAGSLQPGQEVIACDETRTRLQPHPNGKIAKREARRFRTATITENSRRMLPCYEIETTHGTLTVSDRHPWLARRLITHDYIVGHRKNGQEFSQHSHHSRWDWEATENLVVGDRVAFLVEPWVRDESRDAGWLAGILDGEGCIHVGKPSLSGSRGTHISVAQNAGVVLNEIKRVLQDYRLHSTEQTVSHRRTCHKITIGGKLADKLRLLGSIRPQRLLNKAVEKRFWEGMGVSNQVTQAEVLAIRNLGLKEVAVMATTERTFIANGFIAHNSTLFEFAAVKGPVLLLNAPWYRRDVHHGLRYWTEAHVGPHCDDPALLGESIDWALADTPGRAAIRADVSARVYAHLDGTATARALAAIREALGP